MTFCNNHLGYALTWYGLAAALLAFLRVRLDASCAAKSARRA
jgi:cytochrome oxidase assembly protein ShyY1